MTSRSGCQIGQRLHAKVPYRHWKTVAFIAALRCGRINAPFVSDQPINAASFIEWVEPQLCPTLWPGDIIVMDNFYKAEMSLCPMGTTIRHTPRRRARLVRGDRSGPAKGDQREVSQTESMNRFRSI
ncbi:transposase [Tsuneonella suprasediminis]|uniref:transposase n=1 Tax=Tsuneonella suprasediminis TaxID=2306996 RepID=UPI0039C98DCE